MEGKNMKLGAILVVYCIFGIWCSTNRIGDVFVAVLLVMAVCMLLALMGWLIRQDRMTSFWLKKIKFLF